MSLALLDSFNRANESPLGSGKWTTGGLDNAATGLKIVSNQVVRQLGSGSFGRDNSYYSALTFQAGLSSQVGVTVTQMTTDGEIDLALFDPATRNGYRMIIQSNAWGSGNNVVLTVNTGGTDTALDNNTVVVPASGDQYVLQIDGDDVVGWLIRSGTATDVVRITDTTYRLAFNPGLAIAGLNDTTAAILDDFGANALGTAAAPENALMMRLGR